MVRDWLLQLVGVGDRKSKKRRDAPTRDEAGATSAGCMCCAVFHIFDNVHHLQFPLNHHHEQRSSSVFLEDEIKPCEGFEAPRNSLEMEEPKKKPMKASDSNLLAVREENDINLDIPVGIQIIKTKHGKVSSSSSSPRVSTTKSRLTCDYSSSDQCNSISNNSPGLTKTPTLVARLMGLDLLPEECSSSPSLSSSSSSKPLKRTRFQKVKRSTSTSFFEDDMSVGARSLPETPRISSARRSDVDYCHHRLSLQVNKENTNEDQKQQQPKGGRLLRILTQDQENDMTTPRHYAKQIVKNVRESASRRVGLTDITNRNTDRRDQNLILLKPKKNSSNGDYVRIHNEEKKQSTCSPRLRFLETTKNKASTSSGTETSPRLSSSLSSVQGIDDAVINPSNKKEKSEGIITTVDRESAKSIGKFMAREHAIKNKKEEQFVRSNATSKVKLSNDHNKFKKTPLSTDILRMKQVKKDPSPSPTKKLPQKQVSPSKPSYSYKSSNKILSSSGFLENVPPRDLHRHGRSSTAIHGGDVAAECRKYIQLILNRAGITKTADRWHSHKQPADPFIFYHLELFHYGGGDGGSGMLNLRCNRMLIFQLVNELLAGIMIHDNICHLGLRPVKEDRAVRVFDELCRKINTFPEANCEALEDIDFLIAIDMYKWESGRYCDKELESILCEIEGEMVEQVVEEMVVVMLEEQRLRRKQRVLHISSSFFMK